MSRQAATDLVEPRVSRRRTIGLQLRDDSRPNLSVSARLIVIVVMGVGDLRKRRSANS